MTPAAVLLAFTPLIALLSGMAMTPVLIALAMLPAWDIYRRRAAWPGRADLRPELVLVGLVVIWPIVTAVWSIAPGRSLTSGLRIALLMVIGALAVILARRGPAVPRDWPLWFAGCVAFCAVVLSLEMLPGGGLLRLGFEALGQDYTRFIIKNVNRGLCALAVLVWPAVAALHGRGHKAAGLLLPLLLIAPMATFQSLSAFVALLSGGAALLALLAAPRAMARVMAVAVPLFFVLWPALFPVLDRAIFTKPDIYAALPDSAQHRVEVWRFSTEKVLERPIGGWGLDSSRYIPGGDVVYQGERKYLPMHSHNSAIQILLEVGAVGFLLIGAALALVMRRWLVSDMSNRVLRATSGAAIVAYLAAGFSAFGVWQYWWLAVAWIAAVAWTMSVRSAEAA